MNRQKIAIKAKLNDGLGNFQKQWFIYYSYFDDRSNEMRRVRDYKGFAACKSKAARYILADRRINEINTKLENGWNPGVEREKNVIYADELIYNTDKRLNGNIRRGNKTMDFYINEFLAQLKTEIRKSSYATYKSKYRIFSIYLKTAKIDSIDITAFDKSHADGFIKHLKVDRNIKNSIGLYIQMLQRLYDYLIDKNVVRLNMFGHIKKPKANVHPPQYIGKEALKKFKDEAIKSDPQMWLVFRMLFYTFIRPKELIMLKMENFHLDEAYIHIPAHISKTNKTRYPALPEVFLKELKAEGFENYPKDHFLITVKKIPADTAKSVSKNYLWNHFSKIRQRIGLSKDYKLYAFKHTGMAMAKQAGIDTKDIQMQSGHGSLDMVDKYLNQLAPVDSVALRFKGPSI